MTFLSELLGGSKSPVRLSDDFHSEESMKHLLAKQLLFTWLCEEENKGTGYLPPFIWRAPNYGIHQELPFFETSTVHYFETSKGLKEPGRVGAFEQCFEVSKKLGQILFLPDLVVFDRGAAAYFIEVIHTNPVNQKKLEKIEWWGAKERAYFEVHEVSAEWIMRQTGKPKIIETKLIHKQC